MARASKKRQEAEARTREAKREGVEWYFRHRLNTDMAIDSLPVVIDGRAYEAGMTMPITPVMIGVCPICGKETVSEPMWNMEVWTELKAAFQPSRQHQNNCQAGKQVVWSVERW